MEFPLRTQGGLSCEDLAPGKDLLDEKKEDLPKETDAKDEKDRHRSSKALARIPVPDSPVAS